MAVDWTKAPQAVIDLAQELIRLHHPSLARARIGFLMRDPAPSANGKTTWGKAMKVNDQWRPLLSEELDFIIWLAADVWPHLEHR